MKQRKTIVFTVFNYNLLMTMSFIFALKFRGTTPRDKKGIIIMGLKLSKKTWKDSWLSDEILQVTFKER